MTFGRISVLGWFEKINLSFFFIFITKYWRMRSVHAPEYLKTSLTPSLYPQPKVNVLITKNKLASFSEKINLIF